MTTKITSSVLSANLTLTGTTTLSSLTLTGATSLNGSYGTLGQVYTSNGPSSPATWTTVSGGGGGITTGKAIAMAMIFGG
jgi:hypothetical protein